MSVIYKLRMHYFEIAQRILQIAQIDKSRATYNGLQSTPFYIFWLGLRRV